jgi:hypothetical protein
LADFSRVLRPAASLPQFSFLVKFEEFSGGPQIFAFSQDLAQKSGRRPAAVRRRRFAELRLLLKEWA